jgi:cytochrome c oxidase assembly protein Cox11
VKTVRNPQDSSWYAVKRLFFHRDQYLIFQTSSDQFLDIPYTITNGRNKIQLNMGEKKLITFKIERPSGKEVLILTADEVTIEATPLKWQELPLVNPSFHWLVDESIGQ